MMKHRSRIFLVWLLIFSLVAQGYAPLLAQTTDSLQAASEKYQSTYKAYSAAVSSGAPLDEIQAKFSTYMDAYTHYQKLAAQARDGISVTGPTGAASESTVSTTVVSGEASRVSDDSSQPTASATGTLVSSSAPQTSKGWFANVFNSIKEKFIGKEGSKEMPLLEKIAWNIGKSIVPAFAVMLATALLAPLSPIAMIAGGIVVGAAMGGLMTYAYEKRMNAKYREVPKEDQKIWRDVTVSAAVEAVMAPFNLMTGGLFGTFGPTVGSAITRVALTQAAIGFAGSAISSSVGGVVKNLWAKNVFHYPEKIASAEARIDSILELHVRSGLPLTASETAELNTLRSNIDTMKGESYSAEDFTKDLQRAALSSVISGFAGSIVSDKMYSYDKGRWADRLSVKIFGSTAKGKALSSLVSTIPTNFVSGAAGAELEKSFIRADIADIRIEQSKYAAGSTAYAYYNTVIAGLEEKEDSIKPLNSGLDAAANNIAVRAGQLSVQALKYNCYDAPKARRAAINDLYRSQDKDWKKADERYEKYQAAVEDKPSISKFRNPVQYAKALKIYNENVQAARQEWVQQCENARQREQMPENIAAKEQVAAKYDRDAKLNQMLELGKLSGGEKHVEAMMEILKANNSEFASLPTDRLRASAITAIAQSYTDKHTQCTAKVDGLNDTINKYKEYKAGTLRLSDDEARVLAGKRALISPSQYKAALVEQKVYEMKANNTRWEIIKVKMPDILTQSENETLGVYGGWTGVLTSEMYANGLAQYKYDPEGRVNFTEEMKKLAKKIPGIIESGIIGEYKKDVNKAITKTVIPEDTSDNVVEDFMKTFAKSALSTTTSSAIDTVYGVSKEQILAGFKKR